MYFKKIITTKFSVCERGSFTYIVFTNSNQSDKNLVFALCSEGKEICLNAYAGNTSKVHLTEISSSHHFH